MSWSQSGTSTTGPTAFADTFTGTSEGDVGIDGGPGDDSLIGNAGDDQLTGGLGADTIEGGDGFDTIDGGEASGFTEPDPGNLLTDTQGGAWIFGAEGNDTIRMTLDGFFTPTLDVPNARIFAGAGNDLVELSGNAPGFDPDVHGGTNDDTLVGTDAFSRLFGDEQNDSIVGGSASELLVGGQGNDTIIGGGGGDGSDDDTIYGDDIAGLETGNDSILGGFGDDEIYGGRGNDTIDGGGDDNLVSGGEGDDLLRGGTENDSLYGGEGNDTLAPGAADDDGTQVVDGGAGIDRVSYAGGDAVSIELFDGSGTAAQANDGDPDLLSGIEQVEGSGFADTMIAAGTQGMLFDGGGGDDVLVGGEGNDSLVGGDGNDTAVGGAGDDVADLGQGSDVYVWQPGSGSAVIDFGNNPDGSDVDTLFLPGWDLPPGTPAVWEITDQNGDDFVITNIANPDIIITALNVEAITCFAAGTRILSARGEVPVESLRAGDLVAAPGSGAPLKPVRWVGHTSVDIARHRDKRKVAPILLRAGALGVGTPTRDLRVSPEHAFLLKGRLVPARLLVNGTTIIQETWQRSVTYWHVELDQHGVLVADGALAESYFDDGNRHLFGNGAIAALHPDFGAGREGGRYATEACAPPVLDAADPALPAILAALPPAPPAPLRLGLRRA